MINSPDYQNTRFSIFPSGWWDEKNQKAVPSQSPQQKQTIKWVYDYIIGGPACQATIRLREMYATASEEEVRNFKLMNFEYATFCGIFSYRKANCLLERSPYLVIDIDNLSSTDEARRVKDDLCNDKMVETALCFISPKGRGVKWVVTIPEWLKGLKFREQFEGLRRHVGFTYGIDPDKSGSDVCRACFLPWDRDCFIGNNFL